MRAGTPISPNDRLPPTSRYELLVKIGSGGAATVYVARLTGAVGFKRLVAIKRAHSHLLRNRAFRNRLIEEARLASGIHHPNVVSVLDVEELDGEVLLVMDYIEGASLHDLLDERSPQVSPRLAMRIIVDAATGLDAAHELKDDRNRPLGLVHRDVSPHNIIVGIDGLSRITDFGCAKVASGEGSSPTLSGALIGKAGYMAPEYVANGALDPRSDVFALGVVAWEALTGRRLFRGATDVETLNLVAKCVVEPPSRVAPEVDSRLDPIVLKALERSPASRFSTAQAFGDAIGSVAGQTGGLASHSEVRDHVRTVAAENLERRRELARERTGESITSVAQEPSGPTLEPVTDPSRTLTLSIPPPPPRSGDIPTEPDTQVDSAPPPPAHASAVRMAALAGQRRGRWIVLAASAFGVAGVGSLLVVSQRDRAPAAVEDSARLRSTVPPRASTAEDRDTRPPIVTTASTAPESAPPPPSAPPSVASRPVGRPRPLPAPRPRAAPPTPPPVLSAKPEDSNRAPPNPYRSGG